LGEKIATFIMTIATFVSGFVIAYVKGWKLALVVTASLPTMAISVIIYTSTVHHKNKKL
jgi:ATP-binding cassette subfamily B (MDR/TAP) protein 1